MFRTLMIFVCLGAMACSVDPPRTSTATSSLSQARCERVFFEWNAGKLEVVDRAACLRIDSPTGEKSWRLERLDASGTVLDWWSLSPANVTHVPPAADLVNDAPPLQVGRQGAFSVRWPGDARVKSLRLVGQSWTLPIEMSALVRGAQTDWVTLGQAEVRP